jgi:hypothetical protein
MTAKNDITGDSIKSRINTRSFEDNFDQFFNKSDKNCHIGDSNGSMETKTHSTERDGEECTASGSPSDDEVGRDSGADRCWTIQLWGMGV